MTKARKRLRTMEIHNRHPVVLPPDVAQEWMVPGLLPERAEDLARRHDIPVEAIEWYPVSSTVGNVKNHGPELILRISKPAL